MSDQGFRPPDEPPREPPRGPGASGPDDTPVEPSRPPSDPTQVLPPIPVLPPQGAAPPSPFLDPAGGGPAGAMPPQPPRAGAGRKPWVPVLVGGFLVAAVAVGLLALLLTRDDDGAVTSDDGAAVRTILTRLDPAGAPASVDVTATVSAGVDGVLPFQWIVPASGSNFSSASRRTDSSGRTEFRWAPPEGTTDPSWTSTLELREPWTDADVALPIVECTLLRDGASTPVTASVTREPADPDIAVGDPTAPASTVAVTRFPNVGLVVGDRLDCRITGDAPGPATTTTTSTIVAATTTVPATTTTVAPTTTTTVAPTTTTTVTPTTTTTVPPAPTIDEVLEAQPDLATFRAVVATSGVELDAGVDPITILAPDDDAFDALLAAEPGLDLTDEATALEILVAHVVAGELLDADAIAALDEVEFADGSVQPVDSLEPLVVAGAELVRSDLEADGAVIHVVDATLPRP